MHMDPAISFARELSRQNPDAVRITLLAQRLPAATRKQIRARCSPAQRRLMDACLGSASKPNTDRSFSPSAGFLNIPLPSDETTARLANEAEALRRERAKLKREQLEKQRAQRIAARKPRKSKSPTPRKATMQASMPTVTYYAHSAPGAVAGPDRARAFMRGATGPLAMTSAGIERVRNLARAE